jgi:putative ABC transport system permease protein
MLHDIRFGLRLIGRQPGFSVAAILTLAIGIGANTAIFNVAWQVLLKPLPYPDSHRLVQVWETYAPTGAVNTVMPANFRDWIREGQSFDAIAAYTYFRGTADLTGAGEPEQWQIRYVTGDYFRVYAMRALAGRGLEPDDVHPGSTAIVLSEGVWRRRFGGNPAVIGQEIRLADRAYAVTGVMPAAFETAAGRVDAWAPLALPPEEPGKRLAAHYLGVVARLRPDVTVAQAAQDVTAIAARAAERFPAENGKLSATVRSLQDERGRTVRAGLAMLAAAAGFVLLIACANLASLQLARGVARQRELRIRTALGATRRRLLVQLVTESLVLAAIGAGVGLVLDGWLLRALAGVAPPEVRLAVAAGLDRTSVLYTAALAVAGVLVFATAPAWRAASNARRGLNLRGESGDRGSTRLRTALVAGQIALAVTLAVGGTLLVLSLIRVIRVDPGFDPSGLITFDLSLPAARYDTFARRTSAIQSIEAELRALPGVTAVCAINEIPFDAQGSMTYVPEGQDAPIGAAPRTATPGCFDTLRLRLREGRQFTAQEPGRMAVVSESFARAAWPQQSAVGRRVHVGVRGGPLVEVVGVVADARQVALDGRIGAQLYEIASAAAPFWPSRMLVRTAGAPAALLAPIRAVVRRVDPNQPVARLRTLDEVIDGTLSGRRFELSIVASFSVVALVLAAIGIYGLLAQIVAQRRSELGIRLALGATTGSAVRLVMRSAWLAVAVGLAAGLGEAFLMSGVLRQFVYGVSTTDGRVYAGAAVALGVISLAAAWLAARRAATVDPVRTLR